MGAIHAEGDRAYRHVLRLWQGVATVADRIGRPAELEIAVRRSREIREMLGVSADPQIEVIWAVAQGEYREALQAADRWISVIRARFIDEAMLPGLRDSTLHGTENDPPLTFLILRHVAICPRRRRADRGRMSNGLLRSFPASGEPV